MFGLLIVVFDTWFMVMLTMIFLSFANLIFTRRVARFLSQAQMSVIWPMALLSPTGRKILLEIFKDFYKGDSV